MNERYEFFRKWGLVTMPPVFWISAFTYPTGFTTALKQKYSRRPTGGVSIDKLEFDFSNFVENEAGILDQPKNDEGAYVKGLYLEGA